METKKIKFRQSHLYVLKQDNHPSVPMPVSRFIPDWFSKAPRFAKDHNGDYIKQLPGLSSAKEDDPSDFGKVPTWKACPALLDIMTTGYVYRTPCDVEFTIKNGRITADVKNKKYKTMLDIRGPMPGFPTPHGYHDYHFAWQGMWGVNVPEGYSIMYVHPINRFDLPFLSTNGIVDADKVGNPGQLPFFVRKDWEGILPEGTPYVQLIPFLRENWESEVEELTFKEVMISKMENTNVFRRADGGVYAKNFWSKRKYS